jgi:curli production assembly/transport component CsgF
MRKLHRTLQAFASFRHLNTLLVLASLAGHVAASDLVYVPVNPSFGGNPYNGSVLLNSAQATNKHTAPSSSAGGFAQQTPLKQFNDMLERSILNQLTAAATSKVSAGGKLIPGTVETGNFSITIVDLGGGLLQVTTTDKVTGVSTSFQVGQ